MADSKISALPASTTPLAGTEVLPIVQSSTTKQVSVANLTAGRDIAATSLTTAAVQATNSGGLTLKNSSGTAQLSVGGGGGDNITLSVATNINPANAAVAISPTGTGTVAISPAGALTINPTTASTINNTSIGATTALTGRFTSVTATTGNFVVGTADQGIADSASTQQVFVSTNGTGFGAGTPAGYKTSTQVNTTDAALSRHYRLKSGGGTAIASMCTETATGVSTSKRIAGLESSSFIIVTGNDGAGNEFMDLLVSNNSGTPTVITSKTTSGAPSVRVYTIVSYNLELAMVSGTYATSTMWFQLSNR